MYEALNFMLIFYIIKGIAKCKYIVKNSAFLMRFYHICNLHCIICIDQVSCVNA